MRHKLFVTTAMVGTILAAVPGYAYADAAGGGASDNSLKEIVVTAERRVSTAQKTAAAVSVRSGSELLAQGRYTLQSILEDVPGVVGGSAENTGSSYGSGTDNPSSGLTIRGIQSNIGAGGSVTSTAAAAAIYVDDVYNGLGGGYDIDRVEVLRGPQGTLYGRSATSGVVAMQTRAPDLHAYGADLTAEVGNYNMRHFSGAVNAPIIADKLAVRASGNYYQRDSYDVSNGGGNRSSVDGRIKVLYKPTENFSAMIGFAFSENKTRSDGVAIQQPTADNYVVLPNDWAPGKNSARQIWGVFKLDLGSVNITYVPAYRTFMQDAKIITRGYLAFNQYLKTPRDHFLTQELRLNSNSNGAFKWQTGLLYYENSLHDENVNYDVNTVTNAEYHLGYRALTDKKTTAFGVFAQSSWDFAPATRVTAGIRYDSTKVNVSQSYTTQDLDPVTNAPGGFRTSTLSGADGSRKFNNFTYKLRLEHDLSPANLLYASVSSGFSPGDVSLTTGTSVDPTTMQTTYQPKVLDLKAQTLTAYEIGSKNRFLHGQLQLNAAAYYYDYGGYQVANINVAPVGSFVPAFTSMNLPVQAYGGELELLARPWANGQFSINAEYSTAEYKNIPAEYAQYFGFHRVPGVAPFRLSTSYNHTVALPGDTKLILSGALRYNSGYNAQNYYVTYVNQGLAPFAYNKGKAVADLNATLNLAGGRFSLTGYVRNVTDTRVKVTSGIAFNPDFTTTPPSLVRVSSVTLSAPRTFGFVATAHF